MSISGISAANDQALLALTLIKSTTASTQAAVEAVGSAVEANTDILSDLGSMVDCCA